MHMGVCSRAWQRRSHSTLFKTLVALVSELIRKHPLCAASKRAIKRARR